MQQISMFEVMFGTFKFDKNKEITVVETFAGIGSQRKALDRLAKELGLKIKYLDIVEYDKYCIQSYNAIHGTDHIKKDITQTYGNDFKEQIDIFTYSFPCQDISLAGNQKGFSKGSKTRSGLLWEVERILKELKHKPKVLLMENVKNLIGEQFIGDFQEWVRELENLGYSNYYQVLNAKHYGIPQNRERVFMISILGEYNYNFPQSFPLKLRLKDMLEDEVDEKYYLSEKAIKGIMNSKFTQKQEQIQDKNGICGTILSRDYKDPKYIQISELEEEIEVFDFRYDEGIRGRVEKGLCPTLTCKTGTSGISGQPLLKIPEATKKGYAVAQDGDDLGVVVAGQFQPKDRFYNKNDKEREEQFETRKDDLSNSILTHDRKNLIASKEISKTIRTGGRGSLERHEWDIVQDNNLRIRKLTPLECYRLMGFDNEDYHKAAKICSNTQLYKQAGNSIVVNVLESIFKQLF